MNHQRHVIREAVVALLAAAGTAASTRVYDTPYDPRTVFPAITVEDTAEDQDASEFGSGQANRAINRTLHLIVSVEVQQIANYARTRDQVLADVEAALANAVIAGVKSITPTGFRGDMGVSGERPIAIGRQHFAVWYVTRQNNPATST